MGRKATYVQAVCILRTPKSEASRVRLTEVVKLVKKRDEITTTADVVTIKTHQNRALYDNMGSTPT